MTVVHTFKNSAIADAERRQLLFSGHLFVYDPSRATRTTCSTVLNLLERLLGPDPFWAQQRMSERDFAASLAAAARSLRHLVPELATILVSDFGCDAATTYVGAPVLAAATGLGFISHGLGVPQHPHRDTWYAASPAQINWWMPLYDMKGGVPFAFHPSYWNVPVHNSSNEFDYAKWCQRRRLGKSGASEALAQPRPLDPIELMPEIRISCPAGGLIVSSVAQLYSVVPNDTLRTNFSLHFQSVSEIDIETGDGASNVDADPRGTSLLTFVRCSDLSPIPPEIVQREQTFT